MYWQSLDLFLGFAYTKTISPHDLGLLLQLVVVEGTLRGAVSERGITLTSQGTALPWAQPTTLNQLFGLIFSGG